VNQLRKSRFAVIEEAARLVEDVCAGHDQLAQTRLVNRNQGGECPQPTTQANYDDVGPGVPGIEGSQAGIGPLMLEKWRTEVVG
jgi:hypothetical protein